MLYQNDGFGKDYLIGLKDGLGADHAGMIVKEASYETSEPTVDSQVVTLQGSGADVFLIAATPKFAAQAIRKSYDLGWNAVALHDQRLAVDRDRPEAGGPRQVEGHHHRASMARTRPTPRWKDDPGFKQYADFIAKYMSPNDLIDANAVYGFGAVGDDGSGAQAVRQRPVARKRHAAGGQPQGPRAADGAAGHQDQHVARQFQPDPAGSSSRSFNGESWELFGELLMG